MKCFNSFGEMFNAQSGLKSDVSVFNYTVGGVGGSKYCSQYAALRRLVPNAYDSRENIVQPCVYMTGSDDLEDLDGDGGGVVFLCGWTEDVEDVGRNIVLPLLDRYGLRCGVDAIIGSGGLYSKIYFYNTLTKVYGREKAEEVWPKIRKKIEREVGKYVDDVYNKRLAEKKVSDAEKAKGWNPEWDADFEEDAE